MDKSLNTHKETWKIRALEFAKYFGDAFCYAFLPAYILIVFGQGSSTDLAGAFRTGALLASIPVMAVLGNIVIGPLATNEKHNLLLLRIIMPIEASFLVTIGFLGHNFVGVLLFSMIANFCNSASYSLIDSIAGDVSAAEHSTFASIRVYASGAYLLSTLCSVFLLAGFIFIGLTNEESYKYMFLAALPFFVVSYTALFLIKPYDIDDYKEEGNEAESQKQSVKDVKITSLLKNRNFVFYLIFVAFLVCMVFVSDNIMSTYWVFKAVAPVDSGGSFWNSFYPFSPSFLSVAYVVMMVSEIATSLIMSRFAKPQRYKLLFFIGAFALIFRMFGMGVLAYFDVSEMYSYFLVNITRGIAWGSFIAVHVPMIENIVGIKKKTKAIFLTTMVYQSICAVSQFLVPVLELPQLPFSYSGTFFLFGSFLVLGTTFLAFVKVDFKKTGEAVRIDHSKSGKTAAVPSDTKDSADLKHVDRLSSVTATYAQRSVSADDRSNKA